ncbi:receptor protein kinase-like protein ZAR1 [Salvia miltiorrhiza]|uniref:receptor protein kinase-like protein ZAR1 n=1 Tax=Salvia miltiorrhiza TaxID=226208 RepID=UPI0025AD5694|nr:receptor protein kinase-like protein ZAR1 [Salvia miltiorrhiza]
MQSLNALFNLFYLSTFCICLSSSLNSDGLSLLALKAAIIKDPNRALISWSELDATPCRWAGIACDRAHRRVISVSLSSKNLTGYIPSEIGALSFLAFLDLSHNFFSGTLPQQIGTLQNLVHFDISSNNFNGSLLEGLSNLTHLQGTLNLSYNAFSGEIPLSFGQFPVMVSLDLRCNNLTGKIPQVGSLLNQGPTAFAGNLYLCGFPLSTPCTVPEAQNPRFLENPQKPEGNAGGGLVEGRKINGGSVTISVISGVSVVVGVVAVSVWVIRKRWKVEQKLGKECVGVGVGVGVEFGGEEGKKGKFVVIDQGFGLELEDLLRASAYVLGKSRSGIVYRVVAGGRKGAGAGAAPVVVAVRRLSEGDVAWRLKEFEAEVEAIGKVRHPNIVRLRAYYYASDEKLLISDFISNGSLYNALHGGVGNSAPPLYWAARLRIIQETARGLMHIHECSPRKYVHGSLKSSKILLDDDLKPYISGFGQSRLVPALSKSAGTTCRKPNLVTPKTPASTNIMCVAPEARGVGVKVNQKCDVYAFGILVMEILTGRAPNNDGEEGLESRVRRVFREERPLSEIIDPALLHEARAKKQVVAAFHVSLNCTERDPELRPKMRTVSDNLDRIKLQ